MEKISLQKIALFFRPLWWAIFGTFCLLVINQLIQFSVPWFTGTVIDSLVAKDQAKALQYILVMLAFMVVMRLTQLARDLFELKYLDFRIRDFVTKKSLEHILSLSLGQHHSQNSSYRSSVANKGRDAMSHFVGLVAFDFLPAILNLIIGLIFLAKANYWISLVSLVTATFFLIIVFVVNRRARPMFDDFEEQSHQRSKSTSEVIRFAELYTLNAQANKAITEQVGLMDRVSDFGRRLWYGHQIKFCLASFIRIAGQVATWLVGAYLVFNDIITVGKFTSILFISGQVIGQIGNLEWIQRQMIGDLASIRSFFKFMDIKPAILPAILPKEFEAGDISFDKVSFKYPDREFDPKVTPNPDKEVVEEPALNRVTFTIKRGSRVAFVGMSGSGKTTIMMLLLRGYDPDAGKIMVGKNDLRDINLNSYLENVGYVEQSVNLLDATLRVNLTLGISEDNKLSDEDLKRYLDEAQLSNLWSKLTHGLETIIGEKGIKLSGGERQRLGIARALVKEPKILIFDEATSNLDAESEYQIKEAIDKSASGRTTIIIAHRLSTVLTSDKIFMVENGRIISEGTHQELMANCPEYQALVQRQIDAAKEMIII